MQAMQVAVLYTVVVLIWGSTWAAIPYQFGVVAEEVTVAYRFAIGAAVLCLYALASGRTLRLSLRHYPMVILQGLFLFSINYFPIYYATGYITTGLIAVTFSLIVAINAFFERVFFGVQLEGRLLIASLIGIVGIAFIFWPEVTTLSLRDRSIYGLLLVVVGVVTASLGNMAAVVNTGRASRSSQLMRTEWSGAPCFRHWSLQYWAGSSISPMNPDLSGPCCFWESSARRSPSEVTWH